MWFCEECGEEFQFPTWTQKECLDSFIEIPMCPYCFSESVGEIDEEESLASDSKRMEP